MLVELDYIGIQPKTVESFIELLFGFISNSNNAEDCVLRLTAVECLIEIAVTYEGILSRRLGQLLTLAQEEKTLAFPSYVNLCSTVLISATEIVARSLLVIDPPSMYSQPPSEVAINKLEDILKGLFGFQVKAGSTSFRLFNPPQPGELFVILPPKFFSPTLEDGSIPNYRLVEYQIGLYGHNRLMLYLAKELRTVMNLLLETIPNVGPIQAVHLFYQLIYLTKTVSETKHDANQLEKIARLLKPLLSTYEPLLWYLTGMTLTSLSTSQMDASIQQRYEDNVASIYRPHLLW